MSGDSPADERGQLLVVTALVVATVLVALALVLNSAIYTENLSTRETTDSAGVTGTIEGGYDDLEAAIQYVNLNNNGSQDSVNRAFNDITAELQRVGGNQHAKRGSLYRFDIPDRTNGTHLQHTDESKSFVSAEDDSDWTLAESVPKFRSYTMHVAAEDLYTTEETLENLIENAFRIELDGSDTEWHIYIYENSEGNIAVAGDEQSEFDDLNDVTELTTWSSACEIEDTAVAIDFTEDSLNGVSGCEGLAFEDEVSGDLSIRYANADDDLSDSQSAGTYELVIGTADYETTNFYDAEEEPFESPFAAHVIYDIDVEISYAREDLDHDRSVRVALGDEEYVG